MNTKSMLCGMVLFCVLLQVRAQQFDVYPSGWWTGMKWNQVELLVRADRSLKDYQLQVSYDGITVGDIVRFPNEKYLSVTLTISDSAGAGTVPLIFSRNKKSFTVPWSLKEKRKDNGTGYAQGIHSSDLVYLMMPDRFSNGDTTNDRIPGLKDQTLNRDSIYHRHGGDLAGIINHLDYLDTLGVTALWTTPVLQNDMPRRTEHGYAITNHYQVEPRLGGNEAYKQLSSGLHKRGMKLMMDAVYNHVGLHHFLMQDPPAPDFVHQWPEFTRTNYKDQVHFDPYVAQTDKKKLTDGWFTEEMPDLNQSNPHVANYLIQHALWCVEEFGIDGWRIDTYIYVDQPFMTRCNQALLEEYPAITLVGESWVNAPSNQAFFTRNHYETPYKSNLPGTIDFQTLFQGIMPALKQAPDGVQQLYQTIASDFLYEQPLNNLIMLDNHDMSRFYSVVDEDFRKMKMALKWLLTERGIPQLYYGTEVLMKGISNPDGWVRLDFPGGWTGDKKNAFTGEGLSAEEKEMQRLVQRMAQFRKKSDALTRGGLMHYIPEDGVYVYFRYTGKESVMCIMNTANQSRTWYPSRFSERLSGYTTGTEISTEKNYSITDTIVLDPMEMYVLELH